jgi:hypothetical protein
MAGTFKSAHKIAFENGVLCTDHTRSNPVFNPLAQIVPKPI